MCQFMCKFSIDTRNQANVSEIYVSFDTIWHNLTQIDTDELVGLFPLTEGLPLGTFQVATFLRKEPKKQVS